MAMMMCSAICGIGGAEQGMDVAVEPRLVGFNTGPGPEPGIRSELKFVTWTLMHSSTSHCHSTLPQHH
jgi:hypothetical protein